MGLTWLLAALAITGLVAPQAGGTAFEAALAVAWAVATLIVLALPRGRRAVRDILSRHWFGAGLFLLIFGLLAAQALLSPDPAMARAQAERSLILLASLGLAGLCMGAAALRQGAADALQTLIGAGAIAGVLILLAATLGDMSPQAGLALAGLSVAAAFGVLEALRRAERVSEAGANAAVISRRLFIPAASFLCCAVGLAALRDPSAIAASISGIAAFAAVYLARARATQRRQVLVGAAMMAGAVLTLGALVLLTGRGVPFFDQSAWAAALALWREAPVFGIGVHGLPMATDTAKNTPTAALMLAEIGVAGVTASSLAWLAAVVALVATRDRDRLPSRGGAVFAGLAAAVFVSAMLSPALTHLAQSAVLACIIGLSGAYGDKRAVTAQRSPQAQASAPPAAPARGAQTGQAGIQRL
jgi:hypothetical protein